MAPPEDVTPVHLFTGDDAPLSSDAPPIPGVSVSPGGVTPPGLRKFKPPDIVKHIDRGW